MAYQQHPPYAGAMTVHQFPFGVLLRRWRQRRRMTQMDLAVAADSSTRHLSFLETGRAQPSREMVMRLAEYLEAPLRDRNALLMAAGLAPAFQERPLTELAAAHRGDRADTGGTQAVSGLRARPALERRSVQQRTAAALYRLLARPSGATDQCRAAYAASARPRAANRQPRRVA